MSRFNVSTNYPLIPNSNEYMYERQYISIHSEDRNIVNYPSSSEFEIELPQDYCNVQAIRLDSWTFPANCYTFSEKQNNTFIIFEIITPYNPTDYSINIPVETAISDALYQSVGTQFTVVIENGFYNPFQMATELTRKFNDAIFQYVKNYISQNDPGLLEEFISVGYNQFVVVYNEVSQKLWFGNKSSDFIIINDSETYYVSQDSNTTCLKQGYSVFSNWGLPAYLGFTRCNATTSMSIGKEYPRFFYGDVIPGDDGYWLVPDSNYLGTATSIPVYYLEAPVKVNLMGNSYFYLELYGMNCIDETMPFSVNKVTSTSNITNGIVKSSFAKIAVTTTPYAQWFDNNNNAAGPLKLYNPPAERIRKLKLKLRYHDNTLVDFGNSNYSIMLEFLLYRPQSKREISMFVPESIKNG
jgi:hypothetical protein